MNGNGPSSKSSPRIRLLLVDDHALFCDGMIRLFRGAKGIEEVVAATEVRPGQQLAKQFAPDVTLLDPTLGGGGPFEAARKMLAARSKTKLLFLDDAVRERHVHAALQVGAVGYWTKHSSFDQILEAVHDAASGCLTYCPNAQEYLVVTRRGLRFNPSPQNAALARLTRRESEVMFHLAHGFSVKKCAEQLGVAPGTVDNHKVRLMKKLGLHRSIDLVLLAFREGLLG